MKVAMKVSPVQCAMRSSRALTNVDRIRKGKFAELNCALRDE